MAKHNVFASSDVLFSHSEDNECSKKPTFNSEYYSLMLWLIYLVTSQFYQGSESTMTKYRRKGGYVGL